jgi:MFS family permease
MAINMPARQSIVPLLVPRQKLMNAVSLQMGVMNLTMIAAPLIAGGLISALGVGWVFILSSTLFLAGTAFETRLPKHGMAETGSRGFLVDVREGFAYMSGSSVLLLLLLANTLIIMFAFPVQQTLPIFAKDVFGQGATGLGVLVATSGLGGLIGAMIATHRDSDPRKGKALLAGGALMSCFYGAFALAPSFALALPLLAIGAAGQMFFFTTNTAVVIATANPLVRGRVMAIMPMAVGLTPLAVFPVSVATDEVGAPTALGVSCGLMFVLLVLLFGLAHQLRNLRLSPPEHADISPAEAARLVAEGRLSTLDADRLSGRQSEGLAASEDALVETGPL